MISARAGSTPTSGLFLGGAVALAIDPSDSTHLLLGTDTGLLRSRNGGRAWTPEEPGKLFGSVFAVTFLADGKVALCATPGGVFRHADGDVAAGQRTGRSCARTRDRARCGAGRVYLAGRRDLYRSDDDGEQVGRASSTGCPVNPSSPSWPWRANRVKCSTQLSMVW